MVQALTFVLNYNTLIFTYLAGTEPQHREIMPAGHLPPGWFVVGQSGQAAADWHPRENYRPCCMPAGCHRRPVSAAAGRVRSQETGDSLTVPQYY